MSRDEALAAVIRDALRAGLDDQRHDPDAVDRVGSAVGVALGGPAADPGGHGLGRPFDEAHQRRSDRTPEGSDAGSR